MKKKPVKSIKNFFKTTDPVLSLLGLLSSMGIILVIIAIFLLINNLFIPIKQYVFFLLGLPLYYLLSLWLYLDTVRYLGSSFKSGYLLGMILTILGAVYRIIITITKL